MAVDETGVVGGKRAVVQKLTGLQILRHGAGVRDGVADLGQGVQNVPALPDRPAGAQNELDTLRSGAADRVLHARQNALIGGDERAVDVDGNETNRHKKNLDTLEIKLILTGGFHEIKPPKFTISSFFTRKHVV